MGCDEAGTDSRDAAGWEYVARTRRRFVHICIDLYRYLMCIILYILCKRSTCDLQLISEISPHTGFSQHLLLSSLFSLPLPGLAKWLLHLQVLLFPRILADAFSLTTTTTLNGRYWILRQGSSVEMEMKHPHDGRIGRPKDTHSGFKGKA